MLPYRAQTNTIDRPAVEVEFARDSGAGHANRVCSDAANSLVVDDRPMMPFPSGTVARMLPDAMVQNAIGVLHVLLVGAPFKIFGAVIQLVTVNVVHLKAGVRNAVKSHSDHPVEQVTNLLVAAHRGRGPVAASIDRSANNAFRSPETTKRARLKAVGVGNMTPFFHRSLHNAVFG